MKNVRVFAILHAIVFLYSVSELVMKLASAQPFLSFKWCALYALVIFILGVYAVIWQQILKKLPLNLAYANKSLTLVWGTLLGALVFDEAVTASKVIGAAIVLLGVILMVGGSSEANTAESEKTEEEGAEDE